MSSNTDRRQQFCEGSGASSRAATRGGGGGDAPSPAAEAIYRAIVSGIDAYGDKALAEALELLGMLKGNQFDHAAAVIRRGKLSGRPKIDDSAALSRIAAAPDGLKRDIVGIEARKLAGPGASKQKIEAAERRLRRKREAKN